MVLLRALARWHDVVAIRGIILTFEQVLEEIPKRNCLEVSDFCCDQNNDELSFASS